MSRFCREHNVSREWFYATRKHVAEAGPPAALVGRSSRPKTTPAKVPEVIERMALEARARLAGEGWDNDPISVKYEQRSWALMPRPGRLWRGSSPATGL